MTSNAISHTLTPKKTLILHAVPFGYGPATIATAIAYELRKRKAVTDLRIIALGRSQVLHVFESSSGINDCIEFRYSAFMSNPIRWLPLFESADMVVTVGDYFLVKALNAYGIRPYYVDVLYGLGMPGAVDYDACRHTFLMNTLSANTPEAQSHIAGNITIVDPIWQDCTNNCNTEGYTHVFSSGLVVSFGGILNPFGDPWPAVETMVKLILKSNTSLNRFSSVAFCGGDDRLKYFSGEADIAGFVPQQQFFDLLRICDRLMCTPGLASICEALHHRRENPLLLLPINYSQYLQSLRYEKMYGVDSVLHWNDLPGFADPPTHLSDQEGSRTINQMASLFAESNAAQDAFIKLVVRHIEKECCCQKAAFPRQPLNNGVFSVSERLLADL